MGPSRACALALLLAIPIAGCSHDKPRSAQPPSMTGAVVPATEAHRMAAEYGGSGAFLPTRVPSGFSLARWWVGQSCGACGYRLAVRFTHGRGALLWETLYPDDPDRRGLGCRHQPRVAAVVNGRLVAYRRRRGIETAWICIREHYQESVTVSHRLRSGDGVTKGELERMVASARAQRPGVARRGHYELPSRAAARQMVNAFRSPFFLPRELPPRFVFARWTFRPPGFDLEPRRQLFATFGRDGVGLQWTVLAGKDSYGDCPYDHFAQRTFVRNGRRIFFNAGIHGATAHMCIPRHAVGNARPLDVELWYDITLDGTAMRRRAVRMVADARLVRP